MPKISVLMPIYKTNETYLKEAIESILNQTFTDFEFLILDDCPEETREDVVLSYHDKRIKYFKNEANLGITPSRNKLIDLAQGEYLAVFDHDDISLPERFFKQVAYLDAHSEVGVVSAKVKNMLSGQVSDYPTEDNDIKLSLMRSCAISHSCSMIRKSVLMANNIRYEEQFSPSEDYALWCRLIPYTCFYNLDEVLFYYREHLQNTSHLHSEQMKRVTYAIWAFVREKNPMLYQEFLMRAKQITRIRLFGCIPFLKTVKQGQIKTLYLFDKIPLVTSKTVTKLKGNK